MTARRWRLVGSRTGSAVARPGRRCSRRPGSRPPRPAVRLARQAGAAINTRPSFIPPCVAVSLSIPPVDCICVVLSSSVRLSVSLSLCVCVFTCTQPVVQSVTALSGTRSRQPFNFMSHITRYCLDAAHIPARPPA